MYWYALDPLDVLLFREAKPFSPRGMVHGQKDSFPPLLMLYFSLYALPYRQLRKINKGTYNF